MMGIFFFNQGQVLAPRVSRLFCTKSKKMNFGEFSKGALKVRVGDRWIKQLTWGRKFPRAAGSHQSYELRHRAEEGAAGLLVGGDRRNWIRSLRERIFLPTDDLRRGEKFDARWRRKKIFWCDKYDYVSRRRRFNRRTETIYRLSAGIWTRDITRATGIRQGNSCRNNFRSTRSICSMPLLFGGFKAIGYGREMGKHALSFTPVKSVWIDLSANRLVQLKQ